MKRKDPRQNFTQETCTYKKKQLEKRVQIKIKAKRPENFEMFRRSRLPILGPAYFDVVPKTGHTYIDVKEQ